MRDRRLIPVYVLLVGVMLFFAWLVQFKNSYQQVSSSEVKQNVIPMSAEDFNHEPSIKAAIEKQNQNQSPTTESTAIKPSDLLQPNTPVAQ